MAKPNDMAACAMKITLCGSKKSRMAYFGMRERRVGEKNRKLGFTLIELMLVVTIIGLLAAIGIPRLTLWILMGHLKEAQPYLVEIAAKERVYRMQRGNYYVPVVNTTTCTTISESCIEKELGVNLKDTGNFCFVIRTATANSDGNFISADFNGSEIKKKDRFEVWAILNNGKASVNVDPQPSNGTVTCTPATGKDDPSGWVGASGTVGGAGRVVVLRFPSIRDGLDTANRSNRADVYLDWMDGISFGDPLL